MKRKIFALLQARTGSTRLPGKVLKRVLNTPLIIHQLKRTSKSKLIDHLIVVTSDHPQDDLLTDIIRSYGYQVFRGHKDNVLKRFFDALKNICAEQEDIIVRLTGDCPLHDSIIIDETIHAFMKSKCDYLANCIEPPIYPDGFDVEVFNFKALHSAYINATLDSQKEHVTPYIRDSKRFIIKNLHKRPIHNDWRLTVDEEADFQLIKEIFENFQTTFFSFNDIISFLEKNLTLLEINIHTKRNEGYLVSLDKEK